MHLLLWLRKVIFPLAVRLNMQQPPLHCMIKSLEDELNTTLPSRLPRGVEVTEAGKLYIKKQ